MRSKDELRLTQTQKENVLIPVLASRRAKCSELGFPRLCSKFEST